MILGWRLISYLEYSLVHEYDAHLIYELEATSCLGNYTSVIILESCHRVHLYKIPSPNTSLMSLGNEYIKGKF